MKTKATHDGHCQLCGRVQKLPGGMMAKHGYTKEFHFFNGTCPGSDNLPYELSCALLPPQRDWAAAKVVLLNDQSAAEAALRDPKAVWIHEYRHYARRQGYYAWVQVELLLDSKFGFPCYMRGDLQTRVDIYGIAGYGTEEYLGNLVTHLNKRKADATQVLAKQHADYAAWATKRIESWKLTELQPRKDA